MTVSNFDWRLDDYVQENIDGAIYTNREAAEEHKAWYNKKYGHGCRVCEIVIHDQFKKRD